MSAGFDGLCYKMDWKEGWEMYLCVLLVTGRETIADFLLLSWVLRPDGYFIISEAVGDMWLSLQPSCYPQRSVP